MRLGWKNESIKSVWWKSRRDKDNSDAERNFSESKQAPYPKVVVQQRKSATSLEVRPVTRVVDRKKHEALLAEPKFRLSESAYFIPGAQGNARGVNVEELFDIQQQADFFISLGQHDQAIEVLQNHIHENAQTSPLVYLDLFKAYHLYDKRTEYLNLAAEFTRLFNAEVPVFDAFQDHTRGLEAYEATLSRISASWHTDTVLEVIENSVFREVGRTSETLDLEAYRELLLLHSIAKDLSEDQRTKVNLIDQTHRLNEGLPDSQALSGAFPHGNFNQTTPQKLTPMINIPNIKTAYKNILSSGFQNPVGARIRLDIDLTAATHNLVFDKSDIVLEKISHEGQSQTVDSGLIEFDLNSLAINNNPKVSQK